MKKIDFAVSKDKSLAIVNGVSYPVPAGTTLDTLEQHLDFSLVSSDVVLIVTFEDICAQLFPKETYVSPFTGKVV